MIPGEYIISNDEVKINEGGNVLEMTVSNVGDRPIQVGSHYHFYETNEFLKFSRESTKGYRLNIASGTAIRLEPGQERVVQLIPFLGSRKCIGFNGLTMGNLDE